MILPVAASQEDRAKGTEGVAQVVEYQPCNHKALSINPSMANNNKKKAKT
jgi:hypothetical protein